MESAILHQISGRCYRLLGWGQHWFSTPLLIDTHRHWLLRNKAFWLSCKLLIVHECAGSPSLWRGPSSPVSVGPRHWFWITCTTKGWDSWDAQSTHEGASKAIQRANGDVLHHLISTSTIPILGKALYEVVLQNSAGDCGWDVPKQHSEPRISNIFATAARNPWWPAAAS